MRISYNWLPDFIKFDFTPRELAERLTMVGLAVDTIEEIGDDFAIEIDLTSNRPDCLSHLGVAREVAAILRTALTVPASSFEESEQDINQVTSVEILNPTLCPRYVPREIP